MSGFLDIADRLAKLIPRLGSDHPGEVAATAAAIGRTLASAGLDWHDLTRRLTGQTIADAMSAAAARSSSTPPPHGPAAAASSARPRREPSPWPTWGTCSHFERLGLFELILAQAAIPDSERAHFEAVHDAYRRQQTHPSTRDQRVFNAACRLLWEQGWRPTRRAA